MPDKQIKIDLDSQEEFDIFIERLRFFSDQLPAAFKNAEVFTTAKGFHVYMESCYNRIQDILIIQSILNDDPRRATFNFRRLKLTGQAQNILFTEKRNSNREIISKEKFSSIMTALVNDILLRARKQIQYKIGNGL